MENLNNNCMGLYFLTKSDIIKEIIKSKKEMKMLGTTSFNFSWHGENLDNILFKKYVEDGYSISIVAESDPDLYSNALISSLDVNGEKYPIAMLTETRDNSTIKLRNFFIEEFQKNKFTKNITNGIEPTEDTCREVLDIIYDENYTLQICKELLSRSVDISELMECIINKIRNKYQEIANNFFDKSSIFKYFIDKRDYFNLSKYSNIFHKQINELMSEKIDNLQAVEDFIIFTRENIFIPFNLDFDDNTKDNCLNLNCEFRITSKELRKCALESVLEILLEKEKRDYKLIKEYASKEAYIERNERLKQLSNESDFIQRFKIKRIFHPIPMQMIEIDGTYYANINPFITFDVNKFLYIGNSSLEPEEDEKRFCMFDEYVKYFNSYHNSQYCVEETKKGNRKEIIYNYMSNHSVIGQMPRDSFYGSDNYKLVMWALVFDREGRILIHKRSVNAKDNQGMWDKSVGGHIAITDPDTITGASREIAEELYTVEEVEQGHSKKISWMNINKDKIIYLGKWNEARYPNFATSLRLESDEFYSFSFNSRLTAQPIDSMRVLPDGTHIKAKCFVDLYFVVTSEEFDLSELKNSKYLVLSPHQIKEFARIGELPKEVSDKEFGAFEVTPDLEYMINSPEWDNEITKFSLRVKEAFANKK